MSTTEREVAAGVETIWRILSDGWTYPLWVVGAARVRDVDPAWPAPGSLIHHSVGAWPLLIDDTTEVLEVDPRQRLKLRARGWPAGEAEVAISLQARGAATRLVLQEDAVAGPGRLLPGAFRGPLLHLRNIETLRRLAYLAERGGSPDPGPADAGSRESRSSDPSTVRTSEGGDQ